MIVHCPSCHTRYRYDPGPAVKAAAAECSQCEETFPLALPRRTYVLMPPQPVPATGWDGNEPSAATSAGPAGVTDAGVEPTGTAQDWWRSEPFEIGIALAPSAVGGLVAYYLAGQQNQDPVTWSALGGAAGLLLGWIGLLWMQRRR